MSQHYSDPKRENDPHALPDVEVFFISAAPDHALLYSIVTGGDMIQAEGWYWWSCFPGCLPDSDPIGPFATEAEALADARESSGLCEHGVADDDICEDCPAPELWALEAENGQRLVFSMASGDYRPPVSCWCSKEAAQAQNDKLGLSLKPVRLSDADARRWGR